MWLFPVDHTYGNPVYWSNGYSGINPSHNLSLLVSIFIIIIITIIIVLESPSGGVPLRHYSLSIRFNWDLCAYRHTWQGKLWHQDVIDQHLYNCIWYTVETLYNTVNFCWSIHKRHSIARPKGRGMGCLLWVQRATYCVDLSKLSSIKYLL